MKGCVIHKVQLNESRGFTLVEILIATFLFSVALLGIASLATVVIKGNYLSKEISTATTLAQQKMEDNINLGYVTLSTCTKPGYVLESSNPYTCTFTEPYGAILAVDGTTALYSGYMRVSKAEAIKNLLGFTVADTLKLTVTVSRKSGNISFYSIIAK
jgi:prepilin-type N-terminal cleavage/methylation domain-containing protein